MCVWLLLVGGEVSAAVFRLRDDVTCESVLVQLGDVAEVVNSTEEAKQSLEQVTLGLAPGVGKVRYLSLQEIKDQLRRRGVNLAEHEFLGASRVKLNGPVPREEPTPMAARAATPTSREQAQAERHLQSAVRSFLARLGVAETEAMTIIVDVPSSFVAKLAASQPQALHVSGGHSPWTGRQRFLVAIAGDELGRPLPFAADLTLPFHVVVARHRLPRGIDIEARDVDLRRADANRPAANGYSRLEDVVGKQTTQPLETGQVITTRSIKAIPWVRRGDTVTVVVRAPGGLIVKRQARAHGQGVKGDMIPVAPLEGRKRFMAEVVGVRELEVPWVKPPRAPAVAGRRRVAPRSEETARRFSPVRQASGITTSSHREGGRP